MLSAAGPERPWFGWLVGLAVLVQLALFAYATAPGLAGTGDSGYYLHAAQTLRGTGQLLNPDGTAYRYWPPLFPIMLRGCGSLASLRMLHGACLLGSLLLWSWLGKALLPPRRAALLPWLLALSTPWLLVSKFVWAETGFLLLFAAYAALLFQWLRTGRWAWWGLVTMAGFLLPLQRTLGLFLLAGVGAALLLGQWRRLSSRHWGPLALHLVLSTVGGVFWQWYALVVAGPSRYHPGRGWDQLLSSGADYAFVLARWLMALPAGSRSWLPHAAWAVVLLALFGWLWPRRPTVPSLANSISSNDALPAHLLLRTLWSAALTLVVLVAALTVFAQSAAGTQDAERYASVLFGPVVLLVLAAWPANVPRWLGQVGAAIWLLSAALRVGHVAQDLRRVPPLAPGSFAQPALHGQRVGAAGQ